jgi:hypothetical protein
MMISQELNVVHAAALLGTGGGREGQKRTTLALFHAKVFVGQHFKILRNGRIRLSRELTNKSNLFGRVHSGVGPKLCVPFLGRKVASLVQRHVVTMQARAYVD